LPLRAADLFVGVGSLWNGGRSSGGFMGPAATLLAVARAGNCAAANLAEGRALALGWGRTEPLHPEMNLVIYSALIKALAMPTAKFGLGNATSRRLLVNPPFISNAPSCPSRSRGRSLPEGPASTKWWTFRRAHYSLGRSATFRRRALCVEFSASRLRRPSVKAQGCLPGRKHPWAGLPRRRRIQRIAAKVPSCILAIIWIASCGSRLRS
jgi:hypothetical protein